MRMHWVIGLVVLVAAFGGRAAEYHVAPSGLDTNPGSAAEPFRTIGHAAQVAAAGDTVTVHAGVYRETIIPANSGTQDHPIVYRAAPGEAATISGAEPVDGWTLHGDDIWVAELPGDFFNAATPGNGTDLYDASVRNQADHIFCDGRMLALARWPNTAEGCTDISDPTRPAKSIITRFVSKTTDATTNWTTGVVDDTALPPLGPDGYKGAEIVFQPDHGAWSWAFSGHVHASSDQDGGTRLTFRSYSSSGSCNDGSVYAEDSRYWLWNKLQFLDTAGEWYHDKTAGKLYVRTPDSSAPAGRIEAKKRNLAFDLTDRNWITVRGFRLFACTITTDRRSGGDNIGYNSDGSVRYPWRGGTSVAGSSHCVLEDLDVAYPTWFTDISGHFFMQWGQSSGIVLSGTDHCIRRCRIRWSAGSGISLLGRRHRVQECLIDGVACMPNDSSGINTGGAAPTEDHEIACCTIRHTGRSGITPRKLHCTASPSSVNDWQSRIHHNDISGFGMQDWDCGGIYTSGDLAWLRIDHNHIHSAARHVDGRAANGSFTVGGVYLDYAKNAIIHHNVIHDVEWGIHLQNALDGQNVGNALAYHNTVIVRRSLDSIPYGPFGIVENSSSAHEGTLIRNNLFACSEAASSYKAIDDFPSATKDHNIAWEGTARSLADLNLAGGAAYPEALCPTEASTEAVDQAVAIQDLTRDGQTVPAYNHAAVGSAPDIGAFEHGAGIWSVGAPERVTTGAAWHAPVGLALSSTEVDEGVPAGTTVATLRATDPDTTGGFVFALASGDGDIDNDAFELTGDALQIRHVPDYAAQAQYRIRLSVTDPDGYTFADTFTIDVLPAAWYTLTLAAADHGTLTAAPPGPSHAAGTLVTLTATPSDGYHVDAWTGTDDDASTSTTNTVTMDSDKTVNVSFTAAPPASDSDAGSGCGAPPGRTRSPWDAATMVPLLILILARGVLRSCHGQTSSGLR